MHNHSHDGTLGLGGFHKFCYIPLTKLNHRKCIHITFSHQNINLIRRAGSSPWIRTFLLVLALSLATLAKKPNIATVAVLLARCDGLRTYVRVHK
jgi:hypothetical protein